MVVQYGTLVTDIRFVCRNPFCDIFFLQGKFIRINFDASGFISGANIESCILVECYLGVSGERNSGTGLVSKVLPETNKISIFGTVRKIMQ